MDLQHVPAKGGLGVPPWDSCARTLPGYPGSPLSWMGASHELREIVSSPRIKQLDGSRTGFIGIIGLSSLPYLGEPTASPTVLQRNCTQNTLLLNRNTGLMISDSQTFVECWRHEYLNVNILKNSPVGAGCVLGHSVTLRTTVGTWDARTSDLIICFILEEAETV